MGCQKKETPQQVVENYFKYINEEGFIDLFAEAYYDFPIEYDIEKETKGLFKGIKQMKAKEMDVSSEVEDKIIIFVVFETIYEENELKGNNLSISYNDENDARQFYLEKINGEWKIMEIGLGMSSLS